MDNLEKGSWIINTIKHTTGVRTDTVELNDLEVTERAGKSGWKGDGFGADLRAARLCNEIRCCV